MLYKTLPVKIEHVILYLENKYGSCADLLYKIGDQVSKNNILTKNLPNNIINHKHHINIHSPIDGIVKNIDYYPVLNQDINNQKQNLAIEINYKPQNFEKKSEKKLLGCTHTTISTSKPSDLSEQKIYKIINQHGIIGLGGAGFPTDKKLNKNIKTIIINAVECESPITADNCLILSHVEDIINGLKILNNFFKPEQIIIAIKNTMTDAINSINNLILKTNQEENKSFTSNLCNIKIKKLSNKYPNGYSKAIIKQVCDINIDDNKHSTDYGIVCINIATLYSIEQAINYNKPLVNRIVTVKSIINNNTKINNYKLPIGTPISTILKAYEIDINNIKNNKLSIKIGGDYMGVEIFNSSNPKHIDNIYLLNKMGIDKTTQCIIIKYNTNNTQNNIINNIQPCIKCSLCAAACPTNLLPQQLYLYKNNTEILEDYHINHCIECGLCDKVCPSNIPLSSIFKDVKAKIKINKLNKKKSDIAKQDFEFTSKRRENEKINKLAKRNKTSNNTDNNKELLLESLKRAKIKKTSNKTNE